MITTTITDGNVTEKVVKTTVSGSEDAPIANIDDESDDDDDEESGSETGSETGSEEESGSESESEGEDEGDDQNQQVVTRQVTKTVRRIVTVSDHNTTDMNGQAATEHEKPGETCV